MHSKLPESNLHYWVTFIIAIVLILRGCQWP